MSMERHRPGLAGAADDPVREGREVELVGGTIVEEVLQDIGMLDFGNRMRAMSNVALWRSRGDHSPLIGEFAFQLKFRRREDLTDEALTRGRGVLPRLQAEARDWLQLGCHQDRRGLPAEGQPAARPRVSASSAGPAALPQRTSRRNHGQVCAAPRTSKAPCAGARRVR